MQIAYPRFLCSSMLVRGVLHLWSLMSHMHFRFLKYMLLPFKRVIIQATTPLDIALFHVINCFCLRFQPRHALLHNSAASNRCHTTPVLYRSTLHALNAHSFVCRVAARLQVHNGRLVLCQMRHVEHVLGQHNPASGNRSCVA